MADAAQAVYEPTTCNGSNEDLFRALGGIETSSASPDIGEYFLHRILGIRTRTRQASCNRPDEAAKLVNALADGASIALGDLDQNEVRHSALSQSKGWARTLLARVVVLMSETRRNASREYSGVSHRSYQRTKYDI